jgi:hypothetical protein
MDHEACHEQPCSPKATSWPMLARRVIASAPLAREATLQPTGIFWPMSACPTGAHFVLEFRREIPIGLQRCFGGSDGPSSQ